MKKLFTKSLATVMAIMLLLSSFGATLTASAAEYTSGYYTYTVLNEEATITACDSAISGAVVIPSTLGGYPVKTIANYAFKLCDKITSLTVPSGIVIKLSAFSNCSSLKSLAAGEGVYIGERAFDSCEALETVVLADGVTTDDDAFQLCTALRTVTAGDNVNIGLNVFWKSNNIKTVEFGSDATVGYSAFAKISSLEKATFGKRAKIGESAFSECANLSELVLGDNSETDSYAFYKCKNLSDVTYGKNPTIGYYAFSLCDKLTEVAPEGDVTIGDNAFYECKSMTSVTLPDGAVVGKLAFAWSGNIVSVTAGDGVTFKDHAFLECFKISDVVIGDDAVIGELVFQEAKSVSIGDNAVIGEMAFIEVSLLTSVSIGDDAVIKESAFDYIESLVNLTIGDRATVGENAFYSCNAMENVNIGTCAAIGEYGFYGCSGIEHIILEDNATIGDYALCECPDLIYVHIPPSVTEIDGDIFGYTAGTSAYICSDTSACYAKTYADDKGHTFKLCSHSGSNPENPEEPEIPDDEPVASGTCGELDWVIDKYGVLTVSGTGAIPDYPEGGLNAPWYQHKNSIKKIVISNGVTVIGVSAFRGLDAVVEIYISESVCDIRDGAFSQCGSLLFIVVDSKNSCYSNDGSGVLFSKNKAVLIQYPAGNTRNNYTVPATVVEIRDWAFSYCKYIVKITIGKNVLSISNNAFKGSTNLKNVYYAGDEEQWNKITVGAEGNDPIYNASFGWNTADVEINVKINTPSKTAINYGDTLVLTLNEFEVPNGAGIEWSVEGSGVIISVSSNGRECRVTSVANGSAKVTVRLVGLDGSEKGYDEIAVSSKAGFFQKLISFFKSLFGVNTLFY